MKRLTRSGLAADLGVLALTLVACAAEGTSDDNSVGSYVSDAEATSAPNSTVSR